MSAGPVPLGLSAYLERWSALHGGYDATGSRLVARWLRGVHRVATPLVRAGVGPDAVTVAGVVAAAAAAVLAGLPSSTALAGALIAVVVSGLLDSLDGAVAVIGQRVTRTGWVLDSAADRCADAAYCVGLWRLGGPAWLAVAAGGAAFMGEYVRARAAVVGMREIGVVTVGERPTRIAITAGTLLAALVLGHRGAVATTGLAALIALAAVSLGQLALAVRAALSD